MVYMMFMVFMYSIPISVPQITAYGMFFLTLCLFKVSMSPSTNYAVYQSNWGLAKNSDFLARHLCNPVIVDL